MFKLHQVYTTMQIQLSTNYDVSFLTYWFWPPMALNKFFGEAIYIYFKTFKELFNSSLIWELQFDISNVYQIN